MDSVNKCYNCKYHCCIGEYATFLTLRDALRIKKKIEGELEEFCFYGPICSDKKEQKKLLKSKDHTYFDFSSSGNVLQLKAKKDHSCVFLDDEKKCSVYDIRPLICRVFPVWYKDNPFTLIMDDDDCDDCWISTGNLDSTCKNLGHSRKSMTKLIKQFKKEIDEYKGYEKYLTKMKSSEVLNYL